MAVDPKDGSWVWTRHRQGPAPCKAVQRGAQDSTRYLLKVCWPRGRLLLRPFIWVTAGKQCRK